MSSWQKTRFLLKVIASTLIVVLLAALYLHTNLQEEAPPSYTPSRNLDLIPVAERKPTPSIHWLAPTLSIKDTIKNKSGETRAHMLYINFWAFWCSPCLTEMPKIQTVLQELAPLNVQSVFVHMDNSAAMSKDAQYFVQQNRISIPSLFNLENLDEIRKQWQIYSLPAHVLIDPEGRIALKFDGSIEDSLPQFKRLVQKLAQEYPPSE